MSSLIPVTHIVTSFFLDVSPPWTRDLSIEEKKKRSIERRKMAERRNKRAATTPEKEKANMVSKFSVMCMYVYLSLTELILSE